MYDPGGMTVTNKELKEIMTRNDITDTCTEINNEKTFNKEYNDIQINTILEDRNESEAN